MGVIVDYGVEQQIAALEAQGDFTFARALRAAHEVSLQSLTFRFNLPAKYQALVAGSTALHALQAQQAEKKNHAQESLTHIFEMAVLHQQRIDSKMLTLKVGGRDIEISQGELRKIMEERVEALKERREQLLNSGGSPAEIARLDNLIGRYEPVIRTVKRGETTSGTMREIDGLAEDDRPFKARLEKYAAPMAETANERRISFSSEVLPDEDINAPSLKAVFRQEAAPVALPQADAAPLPAQPRSPAYEKTGQSFGL